MGGAGRRSATIGWLWIFDSLFSVVNWTLIDLVARRRSSTRRSGSASRSSALAAITTVHAWRLLPFATVIMIAGLASIPKEVDDAAKVDGATGLKKLWYVTLPLQLPIATIAVLFGIVFTATDMAVVYILTRGGPFNSTQMLPMWAFADRDPGRRRSAPGAAIALFLLPVLARRDRPDAARSRAGSRSRSAAAHAATTCCTYLVVGPFAIVLAFPFYWMLQTSLKTDLRPLQHREHPVRLRRRLADARRTTRFLFTETQYAALAR